jgi:hypothetical protein
MVRVLKVNTEIKTKSVLFIYYSKVVIITGFRFEYFISEMYCLRAANEAAILG